MDTMRACGCGERRTAAHSRPSAHRSAAYGKVPSVLARASAGGRDTPRPCGIGSGARSAAAGWSRWRLRCSRLASVLAVSVPCHAGPGPWAARCSNADGWTPPAPGPAWCGMRASSAVGGFGRRPSACASRSATTSLTASSDAPVAGAAAEVAAQRLAGLQLGGRGGCPPAGRARSSPCRGRRSRTARRRTRRAPAGRRRAGRRRPGPRRCGPRCPRRSPRDQAGGDEPAVDLDVAGAALALRAAVLGAREAEPLAQHVEQRLADPGVGDRPVGAVDAQDVGGEGVFAVGRPGRGGPRPRRPSSALGAVVGVRVGASGDLAGRPRSSRRPGSGAGLGGARRVEAVRGRRGRPAARAIVAACRACGARAARRGPARPGRCRRASGGRRRLADRRRPAGARARPPPGGWPGGVPPHCSTSGRRGELARFVPEGRRSATGDRPLAGHVVSGTAGRCPGAGVVELPTGPVAARAGTENRSSCTSARAAPTFGSGHGAAPPWAAQSVAAGPSLVAGRASPAICGRHIAVAGRGERAPAAARRASMPPSGSLHEGGRAVVVVPAGARVPAAAGCRARPASLLLVGHDSALPSARRASAATVRRSCSTAGGAAAGAVLGGRRVGDAGGGHVLAEGRAAPRGRALRSPSQSISQATHCSASSGRSGIGAIAPTAQRTPRRAGSRTSATEAIARPGPVRPVALRKTCGACSSGTRTKPMSSPGAQHVHAGQQVATGDLAAGAARARR